MKSLFLTALTTWILFPAFAKEAAKNNATSAKKEIVSPAQVTPAGKILKFKQADGKVSFLAVGRPAMIKIVGEGSGPQGDLNLIEDKLSGTLSIDMTQLTTKIDLRDEHMKNKYLEVGKFPTAEITFKDYPLKLSDISSVSSEKDFSAELKLHGITKPIQGKIKFSQDKSFILGSATFKITVTDFMDTLPSYAGIKIADDVQVSVDLKTISQ